MATYNIAQRPLELLGGYQHCAQFDIDFTKTPTAIGDIIEFGLLEVEGMITGCVTEVLTALAGTVDIGSGTDGDGFHAALAATAGVTRSAGTLLDTRTEGERVFQITTAAAETLGKLRVYVEYNKTELVD